MAGPRENMAKTVLMEIPPDRIRYGRRRDDRPREGEPGSPARSPSPTAVVENAELKALFDNLYDAALISDLSGHILDANPRASHACHYQVAEFREMNVSRIIQGLDSSVMKMVCDNLTNDQFTLIQATCRRKNGAEFPGEISTSRIHLAGGDYLCFFIRDVTARREAEEQVQKANEDLAAEVAQRTKLNEELNVEIKVRNAVEEKLRDAIVKLQEHDLAKSQFVSNVSHELKTPLASINHMAGNLLKGIAGPMGGQALDYLAMMRADCERLARTVEDILDMSRIEAHALQLQRVRIHFPRFVRRAVESLRVQVEAAGLSLKVEVGAGNAFVDGDPRKLERVIFNVVRNAVKYNTPRGFIAVTLRADPAASDAVLLEVVDSGIGIEARYLKRVTERFFRVGEQVSGAGLGLAISKELLEYHGASIELESPPPGAAAGTLVRMRFPLIPPPVALVVSSQPAASREIRERLIESGYRVRESLLADGVAGVTRGATPDVVVVDWTSPGLEAAVSIQAMRGADGFHPTPILIITDGELNPVKQELLRGMGLPLLTTPWKPDDLFRCLEQAAGGGKA